MAGGLPSAGFCLPLRAVAGRLLPAQQRLLRDVQLLSSDEWLLYTTGM